MLTVKIGIDGIDATWLTGVGLDNSVPHRAIAIVPAEAADEIEGPVRLYQPATPLMRGTAS